MKRRRWLQSVAALPALQGLAPQASGQRTAPPQSGSSEMPLLTETAPDAVAEGTKKFFTPEQSAALEKLAGLLVPHVGERPGAIDAGVVEFLDFLLKASGPDRQALYKNGLDRLNAEAKRRYQTGFNGVNDEQAKPILEPLNKPWTYAPPTDSYSRFLREAKDDILQATVNSREFAQAMAGRTRSAGGVNAYWLPLD